MAVQISVPLAESDAHPFMDTDLAIGDFLPENKIILSRVYSQMLADEVTLAGGAPVDSTDRVFEKLIELVGEAEE